MGVVMVKLVQLGEYCDCLQNWKKYDLSNESPTQSNLFLSENESNIDIAIEKVFNSQKIDTGFDKELELMHERLKKRKKLKAQFQRQKEKQIRLKEEQEERIEMERLQKNERETRILMKQKQAKRQNQLQAQKLRKQKQQKKIRANKKNKRVRQIIKQKKDLLEVKVNNKQLATTEQNIPQYTKPRKNEPQRIEQFDEQSQQSQKLQNVFQPQEQLKEEKGQEDIDLDSQLFDRRRSDQKTDIDIIDLEKLNPAQLKNEISQMLIKKLQNKQIYDKPTSQTVPLHPAIHSHRVSYNRGNNDYRRNQLVLNESKDQDFGAKILAFGDDPFQSTIFSKQSNKDYFLDDEDKEEYLKEMFK